MILMFAEGLEQDVVMEEADANVFDLLVGTLDETTCDTVSKYILKSEYLYWYISGENSAEVSAGVGGSRSDLASEYGDAGKHILVRARRKLFNYHLCCQRHRVKRRHSRMLGRQRWADYTFFDSTSIIISVYSGCPGSWGCTLSVWESIASRCQ